MTHQRWSCRILQKEVPISKSYHFLIVYQFQWNFVLMCKTCLIWVVYKFEMRTSSQTEVMSSQKGVAFFGHPNIFEFFINCINSITIPFYLVYFNCLPNHNMKKWSIYYQMMSVSTINDRYLNVIFGAVRPQADGWPCRFLSDSESSIDQ